MENKYFTPDIEDIRIGYECEIDAPIYKNKNFIVDENQFQYVDFCINAGILKVPYLTKEQLLTEGWKFENTNGITYWFSKNSPEVGGNWYGYYIYKATLLYDFERKKLKILFSFDAVEDECVFEGECKDVNTFGYICKLLKIK